MDRERGEKRDGDSKVSGGEIEIEREIVRYG
jgi:hypothetical protein